MRRVGLVTAVIFLCFWMFYDGKCSGEVKKIKLGDGMSIRSHKSSPEEERKWKLLSDLGTREGEDPEPVLEAFLKEQYKPEEHDFIVSTLIEFVGHKNWDYEDKMMPALLLGKLRAKEGIKVLVDNISLTPLGEGEEEGEETLTKEKVQGLEIDAKNFPCAFALFEIGNPARESLRQKMATTKDEVVRVICEKTTRKIETAK